MKRILMGLLVSLMAAPAMAASSMQGFHVGLSAARNDQTFKGDAFTPESRDNRTYADIKFGYLMSNSIYLGVIHSTMSVSTGTDSPSRSATGLSVGYHGNGLFADLNYFLQSEYKFSSTSAMKEGSGFGLDFGYNIPMSSSFYMGVQLTYKSISYKKIESVTSANTFTEMLPMINAGFYF